eukprot:14090371-Heterocapsa_arctica.AAC.1
MRQSGEQLLETLKPYVRKDRLHVAEAFVILLKETKTSHFAPFLQSDTVINYKDMDATFQKAILAAKQYPDNEVEKSVMGKDYEEEMGKALRLNRQQTLDDEEARQDGSL